MSYEGFLVKIYPKRESVIGEFGEVVLKEKIWGIEFVFDNHDESAKFLKFGNTNLLQPYSHSEYITVKDAVRETGYSQSKLLRFVKSKTLDGIKIRGKWLILRSSLKRLKKQ